MQNQCNKCGKSATIKVEPNRHACSPLSINDSRVFGNINEPYYEYFCSAECQKEYGDVNYACWAEIDRNASDSECFEHIGWDGKMRLGKCKITGESVRVQPQMPGDNSGQPRSCYLHFELKQKYKDVLKENGLKETHYDTNLLLDKILYWIPDRLHKLVPSPKHETSTSI